jgi:hypothetical protein
MPAGPVWRHSSFCRAKPNLKLTDAELAEMRHPVGTTVGAGGASSEASAPARVTPASTLTAEPWWIEHDRLNPTGCGNSDCYRCGGIFDDGGAVTDAI